MPSYISPNLRDIQPPNDDYNTLRYLNKGINYNERLLMSSYWREQINIYGMIVKYYVNKTTAQNADVLYGSAPAAGFNTPVQIIMIVKPDADASTFTRFGLMSDTDASAYIHPDDFEKVLGAGKEPKAGDVIELIEYGSDRINYPSRGPYYLELTERTDETFGQETNPIAGHYVWRFKCKRFNFSHESEVQPELGTKNSADSGSINLSATPPVTATYIDIESKKIFDYDTTCNSNDNVYGDY